MGWLEAQLASTGRRLSLASVTADPAYDTIAIYEAAGAQGASLLDCRALAYCGARRDDPTPSPAAPDRPVAPDGASRKLRAKRW